MRIRLERRYIGFVLLLYAFWGWSWIVLEDPLSIYWQSDSGRYIYNHGCLNHYHDFQQLVGRLNCLSNVSAVVLIGICFVWLAYQSIFKSIANFAD